jgi:hypothetical protein
MARLLALCVASIMAALLLPDHASATDVSVADGVLALEDTGSELNTVDVDGNGDVIDVTDSTAPLAAGPGCVQRTTHAVTCVGTVQLFRAHLGGGDDIVSADRAPIRTDIDGGDGSDLIRGGNAADDLTGQAGEDTLFGGRGPDRELGGPGDDFAAGGSGADMLLGLAGADILEGRGGDSDILLGGRGPDLLSGGDGDDDLDGQEGDDALIGGGGDDRLQGGFGQDDTYGADGASDQILCASSADRSDTDGRDRVAGCSDRGAPPRPTAWPPRSARATTAQSIVKIDVDARITEYANGDAKAIYVFAHSQDGGWQAHACVRTYGPNGGLLQNFREVITVRRWDKLAKAPNKRAKHAKARLVQPNKSCTTVW